MKTSSTDTLHHPARRWWALAVVLLIATAGSVTAQTVPTGVQEYFVLGWEQHIWDMMDRVQNAQGGAQFVDGMNSVVTATASADNQVIYYDHWEDGEDAGLAGFPNTIGTLDASTLVIGDGNPSNGDACDFNSNITCGTDFLAAGDYINFNSDRGLESDGAADCNKLSAQPTTYTQLCNSVELNPRCAVAGSCAASEFRFDGGDLIETSGGPLSVIHSQYPLTNFIGGSTEILSRQAVEAARSYSVPIGEDLYAGGTPTEPFHYVELELVAFEDTSITVESPGAGSVSFELGRGEHWSSMGFIDDTSVPALSLTVNSGTKVSTTAPITGMIFTGGDGQWATRHYALLPDILHSTDYVTTAPGDDPTDGPDINEPLDRPGNVYILNPDQLTTISVEITDTSGTYTVSIPPNSMRSMDDIGTGRDIAPNSTVRMTSDRNFWGVTAYDYGTNISDWGHSWLAKKFLTNTYTVSFGPGNQNQPPNNAQWGNPVFVSATADRTRVQFDLENDGTFDAVDLDGDGIAEAAPFAGNTYEVNMLAALKVTAPGLNPGDNDMTGARIIANKPIAVSWGQDTDRTYYSDNALDTGFTVYPVNQLFLDAALTIDKSVDTTVVPIAGGTATYELVVKSWGFGPLTDVQVYDLLPTGVFGDADYVPGSTLITCPDLVQGTADPTYDDCASGTTDCSRLTWDINNACNSGNPFLLDPNATLRVRYQVAIPAAPGSLPRLLTNEGHAQASLGGSVFSPSDTAEVVQTDVTLTKSVDETTPAAGDIITFTLRVTNSGITTEHDVFITDPIPPDTTFSGNITSEGPFTGSFDAAQNAVVWSLTDPVSAPFVPGGPHALSFQVQVNPTVPAGTPIPNRGGYESLETPHFLSNEVEPVVQGAKITATKSIVGNPVVAHPNEVITFDVLVDNTGSGAASNVIVRDPIPGNAGYVASSIEWSLNSGPFVPLTDANEGDEGDGADGRAFADRIEFRLDSLGAGQNVNVRFRVTVDPGTAGQYLSNQAVFASDETPSTDTNLVQVPIVGDSVINGHVFLDLDGDQSQGPGEPDLANIDVVVTDPTGAQQVVSTDANGDYTATVLVISSSLGCYLDQVNATAYNGSDGTLNWAAAPWTEYGNGADGNTGTDPTSIQADPIIGAGNNVLRIRGVNGNTASRGFTRQVDLSSGDSTSLAFRYHRRGLEADDIVDLEIDYGAGGGFVLLSAFGQPAGGAQNDPTWLTASYTLDSAQLPAANPVTLRWRTSNEYGWETDQFYFDDVELCVTAVTNADVIVNVDESDPDFPTGAELTTANDPQTVTAVPGGTASATDVGYRQDELIFTKSSNSINSEVSPGQTVTYTLEITNNTGLTQTGISVADPTPTGTTYVPGSTQVTGAGSNAFRVTEYYLAPGVFTGTGLSLTLDQNLEPDYFVILQGSDGDGTANTNMGPDVNYAALVDDPSGTGELGMSSGANVIGLRRSNATNSWVGVVTVVECLAECTTRGFTLHDVRSVDHIGTATTGAEASAPWTDINQVQLIGGFNGAGCETAEPNNGATKVCHARIFPSGSDQINWTRDPNNVTLSTAASTVMVVEWGTDWTVHRVRVQGNNGGDGADAVGEYNTAAIPSVVRANTWIWGTGHTSVEGIGEAGEGALITLGDGVNESANETLVAVAHEYPSLNVDFEVYALSHPDLAVDQFFKSDGDGTALTVDVPVAGAGAQRMALSYNGQNGQGNAYPRPMFSAHYTADDSVRLERRRSGQDFPAWVQGIDFSAIVPASPPGSGAPPNLVLPSDGYSIAPGGTMVITFQVVVDEDLSAAITQIQNNATLTTTQQPGPFYASVTDDVVRAGVVIEYDNSGFDLVGGSVTYAHVVTNIGEGDDSYAITPSSRVGWSIELIDPGTGAVIAIDSTGDGVWDNGVVVNTGTMAPGESTDYQLRVTIPGTASAGHSDSTGLRVTSDRNPGRFDIATDETMAVDGLEPVIVLPDNSGIGTEGGFVAYAHTIVNNTGGTATFDLLAARDENDPQWPTAFYWDSNSDGVYTTGVDIEITNTQELADGARQLIFTVVDVPSGTADFTTDVVHITATQQGIFEDPLVAPYGTATDTTTIRPPIVMDLSGGGTRTVDPGDTTFYPGVLRNFANAEDRFNLDITESWFFGDGFLHPTELFIDTSNDGVPDTLIATDTNGDGTWDFVDSNYDFDIDGEPDVLIAADSALAYELKRVTDPLQGPSRDPVTLTAISFSNIPDNERDSVTATLLLAAATRALLSSFEVSAVAGQVVVEWSTAVEIGTVGFDLLRSDSSNGPFVRVNSSVIRAMTGHLQGGTYRFVDSSAQPGEELTYVLQELDVWGTGTRFGPWTRTAEDQEITTKRGDALASGLERIPHQSSIRRPSSSKVAVPSSSQPPSGLAKVLVREEGLIWVSAQALADAMAVSVGTVTGWIENGALWIGADATVGTSLTGIFSDGFESGSTARWGTDHGDDPDVPDAASWIAGEDNSGLFFYGEAIDSIYTRDNVYWFGIGPGSTMVGRPGGASSAGPVGHFAETLHIEVENWPLTSVMSDPEIDYWMWDIFFTEPAYPTMSRSYTLTTPDVAEGSYQPVLSVHFQGSIISQVSPNHLVEIRLNGVQLGGTWSWNGHDAYDLVVQVEPPNLKSGDNTVEIKAVLAEGVAYDEFYLDSIDVNYRRSYRAVGDHLHAIGNGDPEITVAGFTSPEISVFDVSDPDHPVVLDPIFVSSEQGTFAASFAGGGLDFKFLATTTAAARPPASLVTDFSSNLGDPGNLGRYVVIAGPGLEEEAAALADYRSQQGLTAVVARIEDVYDEFNGGVKSPWAIRDFLEHASNNWSEPPRYVFLAGDGSFDHKGVAWSADEDMIPAPMAVTGEGLVPSDNLLADWDGDDGVPEIAIGRLPAQSAGELAAFRHKIEIFENGSGPWKQHSLWLADDPDVGGEFGDDTEVLIDGMPGDFTVQRVFLDPDDFDYAWEKTLEAMSSGAVLVNFLGHGGLDRLASEGLLETEDVEVLNNPDRPSFMVALTCMVGRFDFPEYDTLAEALLINEDGGSVAVWSPAAYSMNADAGLLGLKHVGVMDGSGQTTIGDGVLAALAAYASDPSADPGLPKNYILIGDPATRIEW